MCGQESCCIHIFVGIQPWEDKYEEMAKAMGIDPSVRLSFLCVP